MLVVSISSLPSIKAAVSLLCFLFKQHTNTIISFFSCVLNDGCLKLPFSLYHCHPFEDFLLQYLLHLSSEEIHVFGMLSVLTDPVSTNYAIIPLKYIYIEEWQLFMSSSPYTQHLSSASLSQINREGNENHRWHQLTHVPKLTDVKLRICARYSRPSAVSIFPWLPSAPDDLVFHTLRG